MSATIVATLEDLQPSNWTCVAVDRVEGRSTLRSEEFGDVVVPGMATLGKLYKPSDVGSRKRYGVAYIGFDPINDAYYEQRDNALGLVTDIIADSRFLGFQGLYRIVVSLEPV